MRFTSFPRTSSKNIYGELGTNSEVQSNVNVRVNWPWSKGCFYCNDAQVAVVYSAISQLQRIRSAFKKIPSCTTVDGMTQFLSDWMILIEQTDPSRLFLTSALRLRSSWVKNIARPCKIAHRTFFSPNYAWFQAQYLIRIDQNLVTTCM